jgi:hypothetical protein
MKSAKHVKNDLSETIAKGKYTRDGESFIQAVHRSRDMMKRIYQNVPNIQSIIDDAYGYVERKEVLGSQRILQFGGKPVEKNNMRACNCSGAHCDRLRVFAESIWMLLSGSGIGISIQKHHVARLPQFAGVSLHGDPKPEYVKTFVIPDTIEGWADAVTALLQSYYEPLIDEKLNDDGTYYFVDYMPLSASRVEFDYSLIRPKGSPLSSGGVAPGPNGLRNTLEELRKILEHAYYHFDRLRPIDCLDILCHLSNAVLSGGIRRSATLCLISPDDEECINAKTGNWRKTHEHRARVNTSVAFHKQYSTREEYKPIMMRAKETGDPGLLFVDDLETICNPCLSYDTKILTPDGYKPIGSLVGDKVELTDILGNTSIGRVWFSGKKECIRLTVRKFDSSNGTELYYDITCTPDHKFMVGDEKIQACELIGQYITSTKTHNKYRVINIQTAGFHEVYDFNEPNFNLGVIEDGLYCCNCGEIAFWPYQIVDEAKYRKFMETYDGLGYRPKPDKNSYDPNRLTYQHPLEAIGLRSGFSVCNLSMINCATLRDEKDFIERAKAASVIGTLQAGLTDTCYLGPVSKAIIEQESLLGVSLSGIMDKPGIALNAHNQRKAAKAVVATNRKIARMIGINPASRTTCIKPDGNSSCLLGTTPAIMPQNSLRYIRYMQVNPEEAILEHFMKFNPHAVVDSKWAAPGSGDKSIRFPIEGSPDARNKVDVSAIELLEAILLTKKNWIDYGKDESLCTQPWLTHNVSNTVTIPEEQWNTVLDFIYDNRYDLAGITLTSDWCELDMAQSPYSTVLTVDEIIEKYPSLRDHYVKAQVFLSEILAQRGENNLWEFASGVLAYDPSGDLTDLLYEDTIKFADEHFDGDLRMLTYALKEIYNNQTYQDVLAHWKSVDYSGLQYDATLDLKNQDASVACAGGACAISRTI